MVLVLVVGLFGGLLTSSTVSADPQPGIRFQIPRIDLGDVFATTPAGDWETKIQIQNLGVYSTTVTVNFYPTFEGDGEISALTPEVRTVVVKGVWTLHSNIPAGAESAIITSATHDPLGVASTDKIAVTVDRWGDDAYGDELEISSSYTGIADEMHGDNRYFAPYVMHNYNDLDTTLAIQNSGDFTASVWIWYKEQGNCEYQCSQHIEALAPGESVRIGPGVDADFAFPGCVTTGWLGSAYVSSAVPLGIISDQLSHTPSVNLATLTTFRGMPYKTNEFGTGHWGTEWYADLLYRETSGWESSIQVQNLTQTSVPTFVTVDFMDQSGDEILFVGDWICRNGATTFYLPAIIDLGINFPFGYVGAAEIASTQQVDYPGEHHDGEPIFVVVDIKRIKMWDATLDDGFGGWRHTDPGETQAGAYNAHPREEKEWAWDWYMPFIAKEGNGVTSRIALRNNANCNKIQGKIWIMDETGMDVGVIHTPWLFPKHLKIIDLAYQGFLYPGFVGAARFEVLGVEQLCDTDNDGHVDNEPIMPSIVVLNYGHAQAFNPFDPYDPDYPPATWIGGDLTRIYEAIPVVGVDRGCEVDFLGKVHNRDPGQDTSVYDDILPVYSVTITETTASAPAATNSTGDYELEGVTITTDDGESKTLTFYKNGWLTATTAAISGLTCGEDEVVDCELLCVVTIAAGAVASDQDASQSDALRNATVNYSVSGLLPAKAVDSCGYDSLYYGSTTTDLASGWFTMTVPLIDSTLTYTVTKAGVVEERVFTMQLMDPHGDTVAETGSVGSVKDAAGVLPTTPDAGDYGEDDFDDQDCPNQDPDYDDQHKSIAQDRLICAYGQVSGRVCVDVGGDGACDVPTTDPPYIGETVTAVRVLDSQVIATTTTDANGNYILTLPTGVAPNDNTQLNGNEYRITVGATTINRTFTGCGQSFTGQDFAF